MPQNKYPQLSKAPIILAILEIKFSMPTTTSIADLKVLKQAFKKSFPVHSEITNTEIQFTAGHEKTPISIKSTGVTGHVFISEDKKHEFHITADSFNFRQHGSYETWGSFKKMALDAWLKCFEVVKPTSIKRISIRYINSIEIPVDTEKKQKQNQFFKTFIGHEGAFLNTKPISNYHIRYTHPPGNDNIVIHFAQELKIGNGTTFPFIVDIDVLFEKDECPTDIKFVQEKLDELRELKNNYFFENLTEYTYNLIK